MKIRPGVFEKSSKKKHNIIYKKKKTKNKNKVSIETEDLNKKNRQQNQ